MKQHAYVAKPKHYTIATTPAWKIDAVARFKARTAKVTVPMDEEEVVEDEEQLLKPGSSSSSSSSSSSNRSSSNTSNTSKGKATAASPAKGTKKHQRKQLSSSSLTKLEELGDQEVTLHNELETIRYVRQSLVWLLRKTTRYEIQLNHDLVPLDELSILPEPIAAVKTDKPATSIWKNPATERAILEPSRKKALEAGERSEVKMEHGSLLKPAEHAVKEEKKTSGGDLPGAPLLLPPAKPAPE